MKVENKKITAIIGTHRKRGLVSSLAEKIFEGAKEKGYSTELINLYDYNINYCIGCWSCAKSGKCFQNDDFGLIFNKMKESDVIIIGSPIYWGNISGIMKNFFDRHTGYAMNIPPNMNECYKMSTWSKLKTGISALKSFGPKKEFENKEFILIIAATIPFKHLMGDVPNTLKAMKTYVKKL
ncbi:MAG: flavodoxin family protein, partial [Promethearchaeota archaeon]